MEHSSQRRSTSAPTKLPDRLLADTQSLANHDLVDGGHLKYCTQVPSYRPMASDIMMLSTVFEEKWTCIKGKTPISLAEINDAASKAMQLFSAMGLRDQGPVITGNATVVPQKTFTLDTTLRTTCPPSGAPESMH